MSHASDLVDQYALNKNSKTDFFNLLIRTICSQNKLR